MKHSRLLPWFFSALTALCVPALAGCAAESLTVSDVAPGVEISVKKLPPLVVEGTNPAQGVAGAFVRISGTPYVAGGALFPEKGPADGGKKKFYDTVWKLDFEKNAWVVCSEKLPVPAGYGVSRGRMWLGGENADGKLDSQWDFSGAAEEKIRAWKKMPVTLDNAAGAAMFVGGGNANGVPANKAFEYWINSFPGKKCEWKALPDFPGTPRVQPVAGLLKTPRGNAFALVGGFYFDKETKKATVDRAGVIYYPREKKWEMLPPLPEEISEAGLVGSCAVADSRGGMLIFGGVNAKIFREALENPAPDYLRHDPAWYKFNADVLRLSFDKDGNAKWEKLATVPATARAGASAASPISIKAAREKIYFICGELKPGFRSPDCCLIEIKLEEDER